MIRETGFQPMPYVILLRRMGRERQATVPIEEARAYAARVESESIGEADRFNRVFEEYRVAKQVTKQRMYLETMERVLGGMTQGMLASMTVPVLMSH